MRHVSCKTASECYMCAHIFHVLLQGKKRRGLGANPQLEMFHGALQHTQICLHALSHLSFFFARAACTLSSPQAPEEHHEERSSQKCPRHSECKVEAPSPKRQRMTRHSTKWDGLHPEDANDNLCRQEKGLQRRMGIVTYNLSECLRSHGNEAQSRFLHNNP
jgi:hypothetical protein